MISRLAIDEFLKQKLDDWSWVKNIKQEDAESELKELLPKGFKFKTKPFTHQLVALIVGIYNPRFLWFLDMGLGKSKVALDLLQYYKLKNIVKKTLVMVPSPVSIESFREQIEIHSNFTHESLYGTYNERWDILNNTNADIYVMNYAGLMVMLMDRGSKSKMPSMAKVTKFSGMFDAMIMDEIHVAKSVNTLTYRLSLMISKKFKVMYGLTGTPFGRDPIDLWSQFNLVDHGETLGRNISIYREAFFSTSINRWGGREYSFIKRKETLLQKRLKNKSLRYSDSEVKELPKKVVQIIHVDLPLENKGYYQSIVDGLIAVKGNYIEIEAVFVRLRQICSGFLQHKLDDEKITINFDHNPKLEALIDLLQGTPEDSKVIIFHEFIHSGSIIAKELDKLKIRYTRLYGGTKDKIGAKNEFIKDKNVKVFLVNSKSGGTSLNLQVANYAIYYESPVSPIIRKQSEKRIWRTGQTKRTYIYDLVVRHSIEERILGFIAEGKNLFKALLEKENAFDILKYDK